MFFKRKTPYEKELADLKHRETMFFENHRKKSTGFLTEKLEDKIPDTLQKTLDAAFAKAFSLIFDKGTGIIEKTYRKDEHLKQYMINEATYDIRKTKRSLRAFSRRAEIHGKKNLLISGAFGIGMGIIGVGIPDIPVFTSLVLKNIYEISLSYGYEYDSEGEKAFILMIIEGALSYGEELALLNKRIDRIIDTCELPEDYDRSTQIKRTSAAFSRELLYMKFLQGIPVVGAAGGFYDAVYMSNITEYANLKYRKRFLYDRGRG